MGSASLAEKRASFAQLEGLQPVYDDEDLSAGELQLRASAHKLLYATSRSERDHKSVTKSSTPSALQNATRAQHPSRHLSYRRAAAETPKIAQASKLEVKATPAADLAKEVTQIAVCNSSFVAETPLETTTPSAPPKQQHETPVRPAAGPGKRKRGSLEAAVPETEQVLRGCRLFYVPDNDVAPVRKMRIRKATNYGAQWVRTVSTATHIVVDQALKYKDIQPTVSADKMSSDKVLVNQNWPLDCISSRSLLNPYLPQFRVEGAPKRRVLDQDHNDVVPQASEGGRDKGLLPLKPQHNDPSKRGYVLPRDSTIRSMSIGPSTRSSYLTAGRKAQEILSNGDEVREATTGTVPAKGQSRSTVVVETDAEATTSIESKVGTRTGGINHAQDDDELSTCISVMRDLADVLVSDGSDEDELAMDRASREDDAQVESDDERESTKRRLMNKIGARAGRQKVITHEDRFACLRGGKRGMIRHQGNPNARTIEVLQQMLDYYDRTNNHWRMSAYRKAITRLKSTSEYVSTAEQAVQIPDIGPRLAAKIEEIVTTNRLERLESVQDDPVETAVQLFLGIYGVGTKQAEKWVAQGLRTLNDVRDNAQVSTNQKIGLDHHTDLNTRIPRAEMDRLAATVKLEAAKIDSDVELVVGGSYRRGSSDSGDIDFIVTKKGTTDSRDLIGFLRQLVDKLEAKDFLVAMLSSSLENWGGSGSKWHGCCVLPSTDALESPPCWHRIDFLLVPETEYGAALIYFTGNDIFNRSIRLLASKKGMRLNQRGLYEEVMHSPRREKITEGALLEGRDEKRIFEILGVKWRDPTERWC